ncbi:hypothetical protein [Paludisphaera rhizosphaerae]|uniref:hypothetical protein n=1 Tax=Paludisphaera rhizosphaerae TaxID=2711216 RepID=UPI0013EB73C8|nr:hypothetical protein [Paludisphaera rhizosphaerae]
MSTEVQPEVRSEPPVRPEFLDVTGLPAPVVAGLRTIVESLRGQEASSSPETSNAADLTPEERLRLFREWVATRPAIGGDLRDDRETIYESRDE